MSGSAHSALPTCDRRGASRLGSCMPYRERVDRIEVIADAHANLPATLAALDELRGRECTTVVHVGDAIGIGPHPREVLAALVEENVTCVLGFITRPQT